VLINHRGSTPVVDPSAYVAPNATLVGNVRIGPRARVMYGAVLDAEGSSIEVGEACVIAENSVLRAVTAPAWPVVLGDHVFVGPNVTVLGARVEPCAYLATGAVVLQGAVVGSGACVAVHALVHVRTTVAAEAFVGPSCVAVGEQVLRPDQADELAKAIAAIDFAGTAFGTGSTWGSEPGHRIARYRDMAETRVAEFGAHAEDRVL
jgi:carbonic anhydrase/acetyltransferase-like protein (isoleucine patch superfamily)